MEPDVISSATNKNLQLSSISGNVLKTEYAVRGELVMRAEQHAKALVHAKLTGQPHSLPFDDILYCNIGNPQALLQKPITFFRQVLSLCEYPELVKAPEAEKLFAKDAIQRAKFMLERIPGGIGAYSHSQGYPFARQMIADFIAKRDGYPANPDDLYMYNGASPGIQHVLRLLVRNSKDGIMTPIPQYPLYSASITMLGGSQLGYYLDERKSWGLSVKELERARLSKNSEGVTARALVIINPGNPTGQVLSQENMKEVIDFCHTNKMVLMADEVYQENVYTKERPWSSFKKVLRSMGPKYDNFELFSFHSTSKGFIGECGHRGGYLEAVGIDPEVKSQLYKLASVLLCPNTAGQLMMSLMVNPPKPGDESFAQFSKEREDILDSLKRRAQKLAKFFNSLEGVTCNDAQGAMYLFPQVKLPRKAVEAAETQNKVPDTFYSIAMLDATGICVVPGSGFTQEDGTWHFRTTFLPQESQIDQVTQRMGKFHAEFMKKYKD